MADDFSFDPSSLDFSSLDSWQPTNTATPWSDPTVDPQTLLASNYSDFTYNPQEWASPTGGGQAAVGGLSGLAGLLNSPLTKGLLGIGSGIVGLSQGKGLQGLAQTAFNQSNPFGPYRQQYAQQLGQLMQNPSTIMQDPGLQFSLNQGLQGVERQMGASGFLDSGNMALALQQYGQGFTNQYLNQRENQLAQLAGAGLGPNFGAALGGYQAGAGLIGSGLYDAAGGLTSAFGGLGGTASAGTPGAAQGFSGAGGQAAGGLGMLSTELGLAKSGVGVANWAANTFGNGSSTLSSVNSGLGLGMDALGIYSGIQKGGVAGYGMAAADAAKLGGSLSGASGLADAAGYIAAPLAVYNFADNWKAGATGQDALSGAEAGAAIGSIVPGIGTLIGGVIGGVVGAASSALGSKDPTREAWEGWAYGGDQQALNPQSINPTALMNVVGGLFRSGDPGFSGVADFGGMGSDGNRFTSALGNQIASAISSGKITPQTPYQQVYQQVVQPWIQGLPGGWNTNQAAGGGEAAIMQALTYNYMNGRPITWQETQGQKPEFAYTPLSAFANGAKPLVSATPLQLSNPVNSPFKGVLSGAIAGSGLASRSQIPNPIARAA